MELTRTDLLRILDLVVLLAELSKRCSATRLSCQDRAKRLLLSPCPADNEQAMAYLRSALLCRTVGAKVHRAAVNLHDVFLSQCPAPSSGR